MVDRKGNKVLNRDTIIGPFRDGTYAGFKLTPPMLRARSRTSSQPLSSGENEMKALVIHDPFNGNIAATVSSIAPSLGREARAVSARAAAWAGQLPDK